MKIESIIEGINIERYYEVLNQEVVCLGELREYAKSLEVNSVKIGNEDKINCKTYIVELINAVDIYIEFKNFIKSKEILNFIDEYMNNSNQDNKYLPNTYFEMGKMHES
ncbi:hypothetical protein NL50_13570 [Clostridium acetobutylicum]|nr:hypothetical protein NL50_13570 [Clostridium acetobutylicum]